MFIGLDGNFAIAVGDSKGQVFRILTQMGYNANFVEIREIPDNPQLRDIIVKHMKKELGAEERVNIWEFEESK